MVRFKEIEDEIKQHDRFVLASHFSPEADAIGSQLGLNRVLRRMGKETIMTNQDALPRNLSFLKGSSGICRPGEVQREVRNADICIVLDCGSLDRVGKQTLNLIEDLPIINIDHHPDNPGFGYLNYIEDVAATTQIIYNLIQYMGFNIDSPLATALYAGIIADTTSFRNDNVRPETLEVAADLLDRGADFRAIAINLYERSPFKKQKLLGRVLADAEFQDKIVWGTITQDLMAETETTSEDTEGIIQHLRTTEGALVAILFKELPNGKVKVSMRAKGRTNVSEIAKGFGGGGHAKAAGFMVKSSLKAAKRQVLEVTRRRLRDDQ
ncbi:MAG: DHH family phosphoesterase [Candidatus Bipolaricaulota bacterium]